MARVSARVLLFCKPTVTRGAKPTFTHGAKPNPHFSSCLRISLYMLTISLRKTHITFTFGFFFVAALTSLRDNSAGTWSLIFCCAHELAHLFVMRIFGVSVDEVRFYGAGICIRSRGTEFLGPLKRAAVYSAGVALNFVLALVLKDELRALNLCLAVFNLLPISYFDGGMLLKVILGDKRLPLMILSALGYVLAAISVLAALLSGHRVSASSLMTLLFIAASQILDN